MDAVVVDAGIDPPRNAELQPRHSPAFSPGESNSWVRSCADATGSGCRLFLFFLFVFAVASGTSGGS